MSEIGELFREMRKDTQRHRAKMLSQADTTGWTEHTPYHFSRTFNGQRMEWWPSGGKARWKGRMIYGHRRVNGLIAKLKKDESASNEES